MEARNLDWAKEFPASVTLSDKEGLIVYLNDRALKTFGPEGGAALIGTKLDDCHNARSREIIRKIGQSGEPNVYTIEKNGQKKFIYQAPWYRDGEFAGLAEISIPIPETMPHFKRG